MPKITPLLKVLFTLNIYKLSESGILLAWYTISDKLAGVSGKYFKSEKEIKSSPLSYNKKK